MEEASDLETDAGLSPVPPLGVVPGDSDVSIFQCSSSDSLARCPPAVAVASPSISS